VLAGFGALGLAIGLDIYFDERWSSDETRARARDILNVSLRSPDASGGEWYLLTALGDLAFAERQERELRAAGSALIARSAWTSRGVVGAFELLAPAVDSLAAAASVFADVARDLGWLELDRELDDEAYWRLRNGVSDFSRSADRDLADVTGAFGVPSIRIHGMAGAAIGFAGPRRRHEIVWFLTTGAHDRVVCSRIRGATLVDEVTFTPLGERERPAAAYPTASLVGTPNPFRFRHE
jgi:hypothetical protein